MSPVWFDNHCHLTGLAEGAEAAVSDARDSGVGYLLTVGCTIEDSGQAAEIASRFDRVWSTAGVHPHEAKTGTDGLDALLDHPSVVAVGECGLDYHYDYSPRQAQIATFSRQIELAQKRDLAMVIHTRNAWADTFEILDREGIPNKTVFHCFTGGVDEATEALNRGAYLSLSGIVTFPSAGDLRAAAAAIPLDRILVETDAPYLAPVPHRGESNRPGYVSIVGKYLAELLGQDIEQFASQTTANAKALYGINE